MLPAASMIPGVLTAMGVVSGWPMAAVRCSWLKRTGLRMRVALGEEKEESSPVSLKASRTNIVRSVGDMGVSAWSANGAIRPALAGTIGEWTAMGSGLIVGAPLTLGSNRARKLRACTSGEGQG